MHGRKKSAIIDKEDKLEKAKELIKTINKLFKSKKKKLYDKTNFELCEFVVKKFPLLQTLWNYRREYFEFQKRSITTNKEINVEKKIANDHCSEKTKIKKIEEEKEEKEETEDTEETRKKQEIENRKIHEEKEEKEKEKKGNDAEDKENSEENAKSETWTVEELKNHINKENVMVENLLKVFCKCYELWFHKLWVVKFSLKSGFINIYDLLKELDFCKRCFSFDDRNFHCWHYRSYILSCIQICVNNCLNTDTILKETVLHETSDESATTTKTDGIEAKNKKRRVFDIFYENNELAKLLINKNFSNFSAWFLKYSLTDSFIDMQNELDMLKNALFTDPYDQTLWQYYKWLLFYRENKKEKIWFTLLKENDIFFFFSNLVKLDISKCKCYDENNKEIKGSWEKQMITFDTENSDEESFVFIFKIEQSIQVKNLRGNIRFVLYYLKYNIYHPNKVNYEKNILQDLLNKNTDPFKENKQEYIIHHEIQLQNFKNLADVQFQIYVNPKKETNLIENSNTRTTINDNNSNNNNNNSNNNNNNNNNNEYMMLYDYINSSKKKWNLGKGVDFNLLKEELQQINELLILENTCKFALLSKFDILKTLEMHDEALEVLDTLKKIDTFRIAFYKQEEVELIVKKKILEYYIHFYKATNSVLDLSNLNITDITYPFFLEAFFVPRINLANNQLNESAMNKCTLSFLYNIQELNIQNNEITDFSFFMKNIANLKLLEKLDVSGNVLMSLKENLESYEFVLLPFLKEINISNSNFSRLLLNKYSNLSTVNTYKVNRNDDMTVVLTKEK